MTTPSSSDEIPAEEVIIRINVNGRAFNALLIRHEYQK